MPAEGRPWPSDDDEEEEEEEDGVDANEYMMKMKNKKQQLVVNKDDEDYNDDLNHDDVAYRQIDDTDEDPADGGLARDYNDPNLDDEDDEDQHISRWRTGLDPREQWLGCSFNGYSGAHINS